MKRLIIFDLDGTLAESKAPLDTEMAKLLGALLAVAKVAIISGGAWPQFEKQILPNLPADARLDELFLLPTSGTRFYRKNGAWAPIYAEDFTADDKARIIAALSQAIDEAGFKPKRQWGEIIEDRGSQITMSALGQEAPLEEKKTWDPDFSKRKAMKVLLDKSIPEFSVQMGGATSIDVTRPGIDKAYGIGKLREILSIDIADMIFVGDALFEGGNDFAARRTGATCIQVANPHETKRVIEAICACLD